MWNPFSGTWRRDRSADFRDLEKRANAIEVKPFLQDDAARRADWEDWEYYLKHAVWREHNCRSTFYASRLASIIAAITVPSLVGLNLAGTGGVVVRWITFAFSLVAAFATAILTLYQISDRWLMYRQLMVSLMKAAEALGRSASREREIRDGAWQVFVKAKDRAISAYNEHYEKAVILVSRNSAADSSPDDKAAPPDSSAVAGKPDSSRPGGDDS